MPHLDTHANPSCIQLEFAAFSDFTIYFNGKQYKTHKAILCNNSHYFSALLLNNDKTSENDAAVNSIELDKKFGDGTYTHHDMLTFLMLLYGDIEQMKHLAMNEHNDTSSPSSWSSRVANSNNHTNTRSSNLFTILSIATYFHSSTVIHHCLERVYAALRDEQNKSIHTQHPLWYYYYLATKHSHSALEQVCIVQINTRTSLITIRGYSEYAHLLSGKAWKQLIDKKYENCRYPY